MDLPSLIFIIFTLCNVAVSFSSQSALFVDTISLGKQINIIDLL